MPFEILEHTAEVGLRAEAPTLPALLADLGMGLFSLITDVQTVRRVRTWDVEVASPDLPSVVVDWLNELLFLHARDGALAAEVCVHEVSPTHLHATLHGEPFDPQRHPRGIEVKAATYHQLRVDSVDGTWTAVVYLDI
ncbi:MAG: archease [Armatimonadota bacterium]|nr:archease [Armatimonadota bacterium]MDR5696710.1 archease [Armatimonadota bacterium]